MAETSNSTCIAAGATITMTAEHMRCQFEWAPRNEAVNEAFKSALSFEPNAEECLQAVSDHGSVVYLVAEAPGIENMRAISTAADASLNAGGAAVMIESSGLAHRKEKWHETRALTLEEISFLRLFVFRLVDDGVGFFSCGFHHFGMPDTYVVSRDLQEANTLVQSFERYQIYEKPDLADGDIFGAGPDAAKWRISRAVHPYDGDEIVDRSLGVWRLERAVHPATLEEQMTENE